MELFFDVANEEKRRDVRLLERDQMIGKFDPKQNAQLLDKLEDCSSMATFVNVDELMANDNPVHVGRNLPVYEQRSPQPFEDLEFEEQASKLQFEH